MRSPHLLFALAVSALSGCVTIEIVTPERLHGQEFTGGAAPVAHIRAENWGWYLFKYIPLVAGNVDHPSVPSFFSHTVRLDTLVEEVMRRSRALGANVTDLQSTDKSRWYALTLVLWIREVEVTANASKRAPAKRE